MENKKIKKTTVGNSKKKKEEYDGIVNVRIVKNEKDVKVVRKETEKKVEMEHEIATAEKKAKRVLARKIPVSEVMEKKVVQKKKKKIAIAKKENENGKPRVAIISLTSCEGCQFALLDLGQKFLDFSSNIELVDFRLIEDEEDDGSPLDIILVEGNPMTEENLKILKNARKRAKILVALGNCAAMGGVPEIKNYHEKTNTIKHVYKYIQGINNMEVREIDNFVKVDFTFPGCPISAEEFLRYMPDILKGKIPVIADSPVCVECKKAGNKCLLLEKKPCFGPMILGGCSAVCPTSRMGCQGCRGLRPTGNVKAMRATLKNMMTEEEFENTTEIYGLRDDIDERTAQMI